MTGPYQGLALPRIGVVVPVTSPVVLRNEWGNARIRRVPRLALSRIGVVVPVTSPAVLRNEWGNARIRPVP